MTPTRPYLLRAFYEWILENECVPYIVVNAEKNGVQVPRQYVKEGKIILNISPSATRALSITNLQVSFSARFDNASMQVYVPIYAIEAIYAAENGRGMVFPEEDWNDDGDGGGKTEAATEQADSTPAKRKPSLKIVK